MLKRAMLALAFVATLAVGSLIVTSTAEARHGHHHHCGGGGWYGGPAPHYRSYYAGYGPRYSAFSHRYGGGYGRGYYDPYLYAPRSGVSFYVGF